MTAPGAARARADRAVHRRRSGVPAIPPHDKGAAAGTVPSAGAALYRSNTSLRVIDRPPDSSR
jgi:hypothetical protein